MSALAGQGLDALWEAIVAAAPEATAPDVATGAEGEAAAEVLPLLGRAAAGDLEGTLPIVSLQLREALVRLEAERDEGRDLDEELLDRIFSTFCIGK